MNVTSNELPGFPPDARVLILGCDDFGMHHEINTATVESIEAAMISRCPCTAAATNISPMGEARRATAADAEELVRLRAVLLAHMSGREPVGEDWRQAAADMLRARLDEPDTTMAAFVVDRPDRPGALAACAVGAVDQRLGGPGNPAGTCGYVYSVATDPDQRRRGYSRQCVTALLGWYRDRGIATVFLRASEEGEPLYRSLGFDRTGDPAMRLQLPN
ncbi:GNAT family N-acetyltransferase [Nonomuraea sp. LPB2021202275-12-8]|uniref:GNAT family N-acetyltransferase n=1 Tax=Nonomuraea sp. LPB2021202275-12-8 TaxID=3120159 RepID=UPI00300C39FA